MQCNLCGSCDNSIIFEWTRFEQNNILRCNNCGLVYKDISGDKKEIELFYKNEYRKSKTFPIHTAEEHYDDNVTKKDVEDRMRFISKYVDLKNKSILEIGSASGGLMKKLKYVDIKKDVDINVEGIELNDEYREFSKKLGFNVYSEPIENLGFTNIYDVIISFHTIEHFVDSKLAFKSIYKALKKNGIFLGEVPNQDDWRISIFDNYIVKRLHYDPNHYYYFSPISLHSYLKFCGFGHIRLETVERYNSILQLRYILCNKDLEKDPEDILKRHVFPRTDRDNVRLHVDNQTEKEFNNIFGDAINSELKGNCLRFVAYKK